MEKPVGKPEDKAKAEEKKADKPIEKAAPKKKIDESIRGIIRIADTDIKGERSVYAALLNVKGIGHSLARALPLAAGVDPKAIVGKLDEQQIEKLEKAIENPKAHGIPAHMLNRRSDPITGETSHIVSSNLTFIKKSDIDMMKKSRCYKGIRHELGLPVRGQRTRSSFRTGATAGVVRAKVAAAAGPAKAAPAPGLAKTEAKPGALAAKPAAPAAKAAAAPAKAKPEKK